MKLMNSSWLRAAASLVAFAFCLAVPGGVGEARQSAQVDELLYVCIQDDAKIAVVDMKTQSVVRTIDLRTLGFNENAKPHYVVVEPDGASWYVSLIGANRVVKFDRADKITGQFEMETPGMLSLSPDGTTLAVSRSMSAVNPPPRIGIIRRSSMQGDELDVLFPRPHPMAISRNGFAYTGSLGVNRIASISLADDNVELSDIAGASHSLVQFAISPDGRTLVASAEITGKLLVFDLADPASPKLLRTVDVGPMAFDPAFTPDGRFVWVPVKSRNDIAVLETTNWTVVERISDPSFKQPHQVVFSRDGATAFVTNNNKMDHMADPAMAGHEMHTMPAGSDKAALSILDTRTRKVVKAIELGKNLTGMNTRARW